MDAVGPEGVDTAGKTAEAAGTEREHTFRAVPLRLVDLHVHNLIPQVDLRLCVSVHTHTKAEGEEAV